ncbi:unnamed protein product [Aureobasidium mustum]|uniref:Uncharacterized protein n=1 Tax=Aureobasidium mustum TaxID=2773714 RepID=A0A9N8PMQ9_9PEZI|nr:unnamed protein product [Aureobasidium mustum]
MGEDSIKTFLEYPDGKSSTVKGPRKSTVIHKAFKDKQLNISPNMCREQRKVWYQCRHELVYKYYCREARRTGVQWQYEKLEHFGGTNIPCEHPDCVRWNRRLAEMRQEALERNIADAMYRRID